MTIHIPVMLEEVCEVLNINNTINLKILDATYGGAGYTKRFLSLNHDVYAIDRDPEIVPIIKNFFHAKFSQLDAIFQPNFFDCIVADIGISTDQMQNLNRSFSFSSKSILDMRMGLCKISALDIIQYYSEKRLVEVFFKFGEEKYSRKIAAAIIKHRKSITTAHDLAALISEVVKERRKIHPATKIFQALRIEVNQELIELESLIKNAFTLLKPNGIFAAVTFHSLEDRIVKHSLKNKAKWHNIGRRFVTPEEVSINPSSRSAKLRWGQKI